MSTYISNRIAVSRLILIVGMIAIVAIYISIRTNAELTETVMQVDDVAGQHIDVTYTNSDLLAKEEWISVYATKRNVGKNWLSRKLSRKTLLFRYDPFSIETPYPLITQRGANLLLITIPQVSSVSCQSKQLGALSVEYQIGTVQYQTAVDECR